MSVYAFTSPTRYLRECGLVHLQAVGDMPGTPAGELAAGDHLMWNYGAVYEVIAVRDASPKFVEITERAARGDGTTYTRRLSKGRLVVRLDAAQVRRALR